MIRQSDAGVFMIKEMDELLQHWADQHRREGRAQQSPLALAMEFGGIPPKASGPRGARDPLRIGEFDDVAWEIECAVKALDLNHQVIAREHYLDHGYNDEKARRLGMATSTYYDALHAMHLALKYQMRSKGRRRA